MPHMPLDDLVKGDNAIAFTGYKRCIICALAHSIKPIFVHDLKRLATTFFCRFCWGCWSFFSWFCSITITISWRCGFPTRRCFF